MAKKVRVASWSLEGSKLSLLNLLKNKAVVGTLDLDALFPKFAERPEFEQFAIVYGVKQALADPHSGTSGQAKVEALVKDLTIEEIKGWTFKRKGGGGISYKAKLEAAEAEVKGFKDAFSAQVQSLMKLDLKKRKAQLDALPEFFLKQLEEAAKVLNVDLWK